ncbi:MAG: hypothetical protein HY294_06775 [Candidatus Rokubacteria bacterium]|nr:hypothetical protein [Candidatus Rokubacteria bacterium]
MPRGQIQVVYEEPDARIVVMDSLTFCDARVGPGDVVIAGSFAGATAFAFALERRVRGLVAHAAGVGKDSAGISGLAFADRFAVPAAAVETMSARLGDGQSVFEQGIVAYANATARALDVHARVSTVEAAYRLVKAGPGRVTANAVLVERRQRVVLERDGGRVVLLGSTSFVDATNGSDVLCVGSHGGRVNALPLLVAPPRGVIFNDGGMARDRSGMGGLATLDEIGVPAATVDAMSARIGDPESAWHTGVISARNEAAARLGVLIGQPAREAGEAMLAPRH